MQTRFLRIFVANLKIDAFYAFYPESFCDKNHAVRKVFVFSDSVDDVVDNAVDDEVDVVDDVLDDATNDVVDDVM